MKAALSSSNADDGDDTGGFEVVDGAVEGSRATLGEQKRNPSQKHSLDQPCRSAKIPQNDRSTRDTAAQDTAALFFRDCRLDVQAIDPSPTKTQPLAMPLLCGARSHSSAATGALISTASRGISEAFCEPGGASTLEEVLMRNSWACARGFGGVSRLSSFLQQAPKQ
jgi:hypothetical protein